MSPFSPDRVIVQSTKVAEVLARLDKALPSGLEVKFAGKYHQLSSLDVLDIDDFVFVGVKDSREASLMHRTQFELACRIVAKPE